MQIFYRPTPHLIHFDSPDLRIFFSKKNKKKIPSEDVWESFGSGAPSYLDNFLVTKTPQNTASVNFRAQRFSLKKKSRRLVE